MAVKMSEVSNSKYGRFQAPFIFKMSFYSPSNKNQLKNAAHIAYIGKRHGADMGEEFNQVNSLFDNMDNLASTADPGSAAGHVKYAHERPGSHGLFAGAGERPNLK